MSYKLTITYLKTCRPGSIYYYYHPREQQFGVPAMGQDETQALADMYDAFHLECRWDADDDVDIYFPEFREAALQAVKSADFNAVKDPTEFSEPYVWFHVRLVPTEE
jgi:hypothetical protein